MCCLSVIGTAFAQQPANPYADNSQPVWKNDKECQDNALAQIEGTKFLISLRDYFSKLGAAGLASGDTSIKGFPEAQTRIRNSTLTSKPSCADFQSGVLKQRNAWADIAYKGASALSRINGLNGNRSCISKKPAPGYCADGITLLTLIKKANGDMTIAEKPAGELLMIAAWIGDLNDVKSTLFPASLNLGLASYVSADKSWAGATPLLAASLNFGGDGKENGAGYVNVIKYLVDNKVDLNATGQFNGCTTAVTCIERSSKMWNGQKGHSTLSNAQIDAIVANGNSAIAYLKSKGAK